MRKPPIEKSQPPSGGPTMYPSPVDISVMPSRKETRSGSTSAISAYAAVSCGRGEATGHARSVGAAR